MSNENITVKINGKICRGKKGETILEIALKNGIYIPNLCRDESVKNYGACGLCLAEAENKPKLIRTCSTAAADGMVLNTNTPRVLHARKIAMELLMSDHDGDCVGPCSLHCPAGTNCQKYIKAIAEGNNREALRIILEKLPLPASVGRVCPHPCEKACRRQNVDEPISIAFLKYFAADALLGKEPYPAPAKAAPTGKKVGVIGGGPGGLTVAYYLALKGHDVTVTDAMPEPGGMLRYGIPDYRLPKYVLDAEIEAIKSQGVRFVNERKLGRDFTLDEYAKEYDAVVLAVGAWKGSKIRCEGADSNGVYDGIEFLRTLHTDPSFNPVEGKNVVVVGGGNTAMDACRTAVRLGAKKVYVVYRRTRAEMPAEPVEIEEAIEEGVEFKFLRNPDRITDEDGRVNGVRLQVMELGEKDSGGRRRPVSVEGRFEFIDAEIVISAIGQKLDPAGLEKIRLNERGNIEADEHCFKTNIEKIFAIGDATNKGASIAIEAVGEANKAAEVIDGYLAGRMVPYRKPFVSEREVTKDMFAEYERRERIKMKKRPPEERKHDFKEINSGFDPDDARKEAQRCLECGCEAYGECRLIKCANDQEIDPSRFSGEKHPSFRESALVTIERDQGKCILCNLCVRTCEENAKKGILGLVGRGFGTVIKPEFNRREVLEYCENCKKCAEICPTGALRILRDVHSDVHPDGHRDGHRTGVGNRRN